MSRGSPGHGNLPAFCKTQACDGYNQDIQIQDRRWDNTLKHRWRFQSRNFRKQLGEAQGVCVVFLKCRTFASRAIQKVDRPSKHPSLIS